MMVHFCEGVVQDIRSAYDQREVDEIIRNSIVQFRESKSKNDIMFMMNMIVMLRTASVDAKSDREYRNVTWAIQIFRQQQQENASPLF